MKRVNVDTIEPTLMPEFVLIETLIYISQKVMPTHLHEHSVFVIPADREIGTNYTNSNIDLTWSNAM
jgi:hypothetical protein